MNENVIYEARGLYKWYGHKAALNGATFAVTSGKLVGLLGPNGSGKTTLLKISAGLLTANGGSVLIDGQEPGVYTKSITSYLPDRMVLPTEMKAADAVSLYADFYTDFDAAKAHAMLADLHIEAQNRIGAMSKGTQEKMQLCLTMSRAAKLYLLDEPLGGVDPAARDYILHTILRNYSEDAALVLSTHLIGDIEKALDEVIFLKDGAVLRQIGVDALREESGQSVDEYFREVYKC
ncbi:ABC transporter ATP-binding protein [Subdoligranulum variabile]|uniref:ABC transporter ATP-binding protein n=1 Tax=Subdoligranulum variabile TaxID=214851 RepID=UPI002941F17F|nr:ABC transporter ATP-binding protein [Subdoligranulum variabile]